MKEVIKRNGDKVAFDKQKIIIAIEKAMKANGNINHNISNKIADEIETIAKDKTFNIADIESLVYSKLIDNKEYNVARLYEGYRAVREYQRNTNTIDKKVMAVINGTDDNIKDNSNKNTALISTMRDLVAEEVSKDLCLRTKFPPHITQAHEEGLIYIHDLGHYLNPSTNCCLVNLDDMLQNGTVINGKLITKPHSFRTACTIATQIIAQVASGQFGGQTITLEHLAHFVRISKENILKEIEDEYQTLNVYLSEEDKDEIANKRLAKEIKDGIQTFQYQINTLQTSNGQAPFLSVLLHIDCGNEYEHEIALLVEEMLRQRIKGMQNEVGAWISPAFPKLLYVTDENNVYKDSKYYHITELAAKCVAKRMMPDFLSGKKLMENYGGIIPPMGCRAFLSPYKGTINNTEGELKWWGRLNMGLTTINLADAGLSAHGDIDKFWEILDDRLELCKESLLLRYKKLEDVTSDVSPIHWQHGAIARLPKHTPIKPLLQEGYATITLGYIGVYECVKALTGESNTSESGEELAVQIVQHLKDKTLEWKKEYGLGFALYGTPSESLTGRLAELTRKRFGVIEGITDRNYLTNSFHVFVKEDINAFDKIQYESKFHQISSGGCVTVIETPNMSDNIEAILTLIQFMYENIQYAEFNTKLDYCMECGYEGEMLCKDDYQTWYCPNCGNEDKDRMNVVRRTCGYLGENFWCEGRTQEIVERVMHI